MKKIVVAGCGFGGLQLVRHLDKGLFDILIIDKINHHQFPPLFYQVAASQIEPSTISFPIRKIFQKRRDVRIRLAQVYSVNDSEKYIDTSIGRFGYDYLVIATGSTTNFYGNGQIENNALVLKSTYQSINVRNVILNNFEKLLYAVNKEGLYNIIIVGGGATGVELAGAFAEMTKDILPKDYPNIDPGKVNVYLLEGGKHTLAAMSPFAQKYSESYLRSMGVIVKTGAIVQNYDGEVLTLQSGEVIPARNVIWSAGVKGNAIGGIPEGAVLQNGRIKVNRINMVEGMHNVFAIGDVSYMETERYPRGHPQLANVAIGQGKNLARNLQRMENRIKPLRQYEYRNLGTMATVGRNKAVVDLPFVRFKGRFAWFVWMFFHLMLILSVRNKLIVFINWAWNYFTRNNSLRLILKDSD
ncbi:MULTISPECIES: NAD(P)/FAD-dependent oxidoreductase [Proteiniphilum]|jgi:NADH dehydrogenase|uniref:NAD(P)/FAD-dependent oxidoreductase n=1 Tax=Proteiniphilum TaxID=294702 RepID=UPI001EEA1071|nr:MULTISPECIES: NAD(P)/FAD-dependent oxidoreductase [Proteiniphilum]ULB34209.1 NAD(P)/FAD-dependent oxidoreductase [Proteiniphilum propionicum]